MKRLLLAFLSAVVSVSLFAQELSEEVQAVTDACNAMRTAIYTGSMPALQAASESLKQCDSRYFGTLKRLDNGKQSLDWHFVFEPAFADSLIAGRDVYRFAQRYAQLRNSRSVGQKAKVLYATHVVDAGTSAKFSFPSRGRQELVVITEPEGLVTLRVHDTRHDRWYNDNVDETAGRPVRILVFDLPEKEIEGFRLSLESSCQRSFSQAIKTASTREGKPSSYLSFKDSGRSCAASSVKPPKQVFNNSSALVRQRR